MQIQNNMNIKFVSLIVVVSLLIGAGIFFLSRNDDSEATSESDETENQVSNIKLSPSPSPTPTPKPIDKTTDLKAEMENLTVPDFSNDYVRLKEEVNTGF